MSNAQNKFRIAGVIVSVGDKVNYGFNGDYYTAEVIEVSASGHQVRVQEKDLGVSLFTRRSNGSYRSAGRGTWLLAPGERDERNPSF